jgi:hypothetical protein
MLARALQLKSLISVVDPDPDSMWSLDPYPDSDSQSGSGSGSRRAKNGPEKYKTISSFDVLDVLFSGLTYPVAWASQG